jgi:phenylacetate-CoA ligase
MQASPHQSAALARYDRLSREELDALKLAKVRRLLVRAQQNNRFYRDRFAAAKVDVGAINSLADFAAAVPTCTKADFLKDQQDAPPFGHRLGVPRENVVLLNMTGGTSGQGQELYGRTNHDVAMQGFLHYLPWFLAGLRPGDLALNCVPTGGFTTGGWGPPEGFRVAGATALNAGGVTGSAQKVELMSRFSDVAFIYASMNYLHTLTEEIRNAGFLPRDRFRKMRGLFIAGEGYPAKWAEHIVEDWGCPLHEGYGSTQGAGFIASTCEKGVVRRDGRTPCMHIFEWENLVEIVDPETGRHVGPGEIGEIVLTNLSILGSPVIRFATRDKARFIPGTECGCGRSWHCIEAGSIERYDDMLKIRGNNVWPATVDGILFSHPEIAEYQARVYTDEAGRTAVDLQYALKPGDGGVAQGDLPKVLAQEIKDRTNVWMTLSEVPRDALPTFTYKARRWKDERKAGYAGPGGA